MTSEESFSEMESELIFPSTELFKTIVEIAETLLTDVIFIFSDKGLHIGQMDASKSSNMGMFLGKDEFEKFTGFFDGVQICLGMDTLTGLTKKALKKTAESKLYLGVDWEQRVANIEVIGHGKTTFQPRLLQPEEHRLSNFIPLDTETSFIMKSAMFINALNSVIASGSPTVRITVTSTEVRFSGEGQTLGRTGDTIKVTEKNFPEFRVERVTRPITTDEGEEELEIGISAEYASTFMGYLAKWVDKSNDIKIEFSTNKPAKFEIAIGKKGRIWQVIAPKVARR